MVLYVCLCVHVSTSVCACFFFSWGQFSAETRLFPPAALFRNAFFFRFAVAVKWCGLLFVSLFV